MGGDPGDFIALAQQCCDLTACSFGRKSTERDDVRRWNQYWGNSGDGNIRIRNYVCACTLELYHRFDVCTLEVCMNI